MIDFPPPQEHKFQDDPVEISSEDIEIIDNGNDFDSINMFSESGECLSFTCGTANCSIHVCVDHHCKKFGCEQFEEQDQPPQDNV